MESKIRTALIVLGMHRSGTSAMAGLLGEMGCDLPADIMAAAEMNAKGFFESNKITKINEDILASAGMTWFDLSRFPDNWYQSSKALEFRERASAALVEEFGKSRLFVMKDPRNCRLMRFWEIVLAEHEIQTAYVSIHRDPIEVAASLMRWAGYEPYYGQVLWLRYVLDAEIASRGRKRVFVSYDQLLSDWPGLIKRLSVNLDIVFPRSVQTAASGVRGFLSRDLKHLSSKELSIPRLDESADWLATALDVLNRWSQTGESPSDYAALDRVRNELDAASDTMAPVLDELLVLYRELERAHKDRTETQSKLEQFSRELERAHKDRTETQSKLEQSNTALLNSESSLAVTRVALHEVRLQSQNLEKELGARNDELQKARQRPLRNLRKYIEFRALKALSSSRSPLPLDMKSRFARSAGKRNPGRDFLGNQSSRASVGSERRGDFSKPGQVLFRPDRPTVIVVTHDASRTGAPILALNMARVLSSRYNIVTICLQGGDLVSDFQQTSINVFLANQADRSRSTFADMVSDIIARGRPAFAIVNSIESRHVLGALHDRDIPSVALFHEFASYTLPKSAFAEAFHLADEVVFSTELTIRNAMEQTSFVRTPRFHVLAQGRCAVPRRDTDEALRQMERDRLTSLLRPVGGEADEFLVVGAGSVQMRKGVDLFIDVARRVLSTEDGRKARFAWIGAGYNPEHDAAYSVYIRDQIERAELAGRMMMMEATEEIEHVYGLSNLLLLTSRLDPLPNVAIDALSEGVPVVCFDKTTGLADLLVDAGLRDACVADYLDTQQAADRVLQFIRSPGTYRQVCEASKAFAARTFDFDAYAAQIEALGLRARRAEARRANDVSVIAAADEFDPVFMLPPQRTAATKTAAAEYYVTENQRQTIPRRPEPGFNPLVYEQYLEVESPTDVDVYAEFLRRGRPTGPWLRSVIRESASASLPKGKAQPRTALHIHAYYPELVAPIADRLSLNETHPDLFINAADQRSLDAAVKALRDYRGRIAEARVVINRGRDIGPLLTEFGSRLVSDYELIGHVHTKKSTSLSDRELVDRWVGFLYENMVGGRRGGAMMDRTIAAFAVNERLGIVFPADPNIMAWSSNDDIAYKLAPRLGLERLPEFIDFPVGSMFWLRTAALRPFVELELGWNDYPPEPVPYDRTILHTLERLFGVVTEHQGLEVAFTNVKGVTR